MLATFPVPPSTPDDRLDSWKEIAAYLKRGVRTVQRWEQAEGLPVHRLAHDRQSTVFAYKTELDAWWSSRRIDTEGAAAEAAAVFHLEPELETAAAPEAEPVPAGLAPRRPWRWAAVGLGVVLAVAAIVAAFRLRPQAPLAPLPLTTERGFEGHPSFSPDGSQVVYHAWQEGRPPALYIKTIGSESVRRLTPVEAGSWAPAWSPDGASIAFFRKTAVEAPVELRVVPAVGGPERVVARLERRTGGLSWSPDGLWLVAANGYERMRIRAFASDGRESRDLTSPDPGWRDSDPVISPDGEWLVWVRANLSAYELRRVRLAPGLLPQGGGEVLRRSTETTAGPVFTPDGAGLLYSAGLFEEHMDLWRLPLQPAVGHPELVLRTGDRLNEPAMPAAGGRLAYRQSKLFRTQTARLRIGPGGTGLGAPEVVLGTAAHSDMNAQYSPDGRRIAFNSTRSGFSEVWVAAADGTGARPLTTLQATVTSSPRWSPDGEWVTFESNREGQFEIYRVRAAGGEPQRLTEAPGLDALPSYSRDGRWIYFASDREGGFEVWKLPAAGGEARRVTRDGGYAAFESPDGRWLYYTSRQGSSPLWRRPVAGGAREPVTADVSPFLFTPVAEGVLYAAKGGILMLWRASAGRAETVGRLPESLSYGLSADPAGRAVLVSLADSPGGSDLMWVEGFRR